MNNSNTHIQARISFFQFTSVFLLGFTSLGTQIILLRKFLSVFEGNELVLGIIMANWMLLTGVGARLGKFIPSGWFHFRALSVMHVVIGMLPVLTVWGIYWAKWQLLPQGQMVGIQQVFYVSALMIAPYGLISGAFFTFLSGWFSQWQSANIIHKVYSAEAQGSIAGGTAMNVLLIIFFPEHLVLTTLALLNMLFVLFVALRNKMWISTVVLGVIVASTALFSIFIDIEKQGLRWLYQGQQVLDYRDTPYGRLVVTQKEEEHYLYENGILLAHSNEPVKTEENVHYAMVQHPKPRKVLIVSGGITGALDEILKYPSVETVDYVELNPWIVRYGEQYFSFECNSGVNLIHQDPRLYIRDAQKKWDVVLLNLPPPETAQLNRFYTHQFFQEVKKHLTARGVISLSLPSPGSYLSDEAIHFHSIIYNTLKEVFAHTTLIPSGKNYLLASDGKVTPQVAQKMQAYDFETQFVNPYYLDDQLLQDESRQLQKQLTSNTALNEDFRPIAYFEHLKYWLSFFRKNTAWYLAGLFVFLLVVVIRTDYIQISIFTAGFTGAAMEFILMLAFQVIFGYVYQTSAAFLTVFMAGLAVASWSYRRWLRAITPASFMRVHGIILAFAALLPLLLVAMQRDWPADWLVHGVFYLLTFFIAFLIGLMFSIAVRLQEKRYRQIAGNIYSIDLVGSALGALLTASFLVPLWGFYKVCWLLAGINAIAVANAFFSKKRLTG